MRPCWLALVLEQINDTVMDLRSRKGPDLGRRIRTLVFIGFEGILGYLCGDVCLASTVRKKHLG